MIWKQAINLEAINQFGAQTLVETLGIEFIEVGDDFLVARMPVDHRTHQPMRLLHGGASCALAETMGSVAGVLCLDDPSKYSVVGVEINASHLSSVKEGFVYATARPLKIGKRMQFWQIEIKDERERLVCVSRLTLAVVEQR